MSGNLQKETYRADANFFRDGLYLIAVDFIERHVAEFFNVGELLEDRGNHSARPTPSSPEVDDDGLVAIDLYTISIATLIAFKYLPLP